MKNLIFLLGLLSATPTFAGITVNNCVIVEPAPNVNRTALFLTADYSVDDEVEALRLPSPEAIVGASIDELSDDIQIHKTKMKDGVMTMQRIPRVKLKPNGRTTFKKGADHIMLMNLKKRPVAGETYSIDVWLTYLGNTQCTATVVKTSQLMP